MKNSFNYPAIIVSALASLGIGFVWFTVLFKTAYIQDLGKTREQMAQGPNAIVASSYQLLGNLVMALVLAWLLRKLGYETVGESLRLGILIWLGFVAAIIGPMYAFQAFSFRLFLIISVGYLLCILATSAILAVWKG